MQPQLDKTTQNREQTAASVLPMEPKQPIDFDSYSDREVLYIVVPYPRSKLVDGVWYFRTPGGEYRPFSFQKQVRYRPKTANFKRVDSAKTNRPRARVQFEGKKQSSTETALRETLTSRFGPNRPES